jgi:signal transduction histidine kinase
MVLPSKNDVSSWFGFLSECAAVFVFLMGCAVLSGWVFDIGLLKFDSPNMVRMKANAAFSFILSGASLLLAGRERGTPWNRRISRGLALVVALLGFLTLCEFLFGWELGVDQLLAREAPGAVKTSSPGRMAPNAALNFVLIGISLLLLSARRGDRVVSALGFSAFAISLFALMGHAYSTEAIRVAASYTHIALYTALTFLVLSAGVLFALRGRGWMSVFTSDGPGGVMARRLLPAVIAVPFALGWARLQGQRIGLYGTEFGLGLMVTSSIVILAVVVWRSARALNRAEAVRKEAAQALARRTEELARSNQELEKFAYVASHDLQEPLRMVSSFAQLLARRFQGKLGLEADEYIGYVTDGAGRMQRLINDLLAYSRVGTRGGTFEPTDCSLVLRRTLDNLRIAIRESGADIKSDPLPVVAADRSQLVQLFQNLIGNAVKFRGGERPRIHVSARRNGIEWMFSVSDNGIGIDPKYFDRIFTIFQRLHGRAEYAGTGIGLAICKKIVERHGGRIWVESQPGKGSAFFFTMPAKGGNGNAR